MNTQAILATILILCGAMVMALALFGTRRILSRVTDGHYGRSWRILSALMAFFCLGYFGAIGLVWADITSWLLILVGVVFLFGALFVFLVVKIGYLTIEELYETRYSRDTLEEEIHKRTAELEAKNTVLVKSQEELARSRDEALQAFQARSAFLRNMSHELRTPLNAILGYSEVMLEEIAEGEYERIATDLQKIHLAGQNLLLMVKNILHLSKIETGELKPVWGAFDVSEMLQQAAADVAPLLSENHNELVMEIEPTLTVIKSDGPRIQQVFYNLLNNACKFTKNGTITITAAKEFVGPEQWLCIKVADTGVGIDPDYMAHLFEPFTQADSSLTRKFGGVGLGLTLAQRFCQMLGGELEVESVYGSGSTFTMRLPLLPLTESAEAFVDQFSSSRPTALIVDDDPAARELISRWLIREGFSVKTATNGGEGIQLARALHPEVITLDVMMPDVDGWHVLSTLKTDSATADIPIVMMTIVEEKEYGYALGAADYLTKPIDREQLIQVVRRYAAPVKTPSILVVEDDAATRDIMQRTLLRHGWQVETAPNGRVALDKVAAFRPLLILLDLMMPEMDGFQFLAEFRQLNGAENVPIIVLTAKDLTRDERERLSRYVTLIMQKGIYRQDNLLAEIRRLTSKQLM